MKEDNYIKYLPAIFQRDDEDHFLENFLKGFEFVLTGRDEKTPIASVSMSHILEGMDQFFDPDVTPDNFVEWLAGWVALEVKRGELWEGKKGKEDGKKEGGQNLPLEETGTGRNRHLIRNLIPIYHRRGTKKGIEEALLIYLGEEAKIITVNELLEPFQVGVKPSAIIGTGTVVGESHPYYFRVDIDLPLPTSRVNGRAKKREVGLILDDEKPAHTFYTLTVKAPPMRIGYQCTIGEDTLVGGFIL